MKAKLLPHLNELLRTHFMLRRNFYCIFNVVRFFSFFSYNFVSFLLPSRDDNGGNLMFVRGRRALVFFPMEGSYKQKASQYKKKIKCFHSRNRIYFIIICTIFIIFKHRLLYFFVNFRQTISV